MIMGEALYSPYRRRKKINNLQVAQTTVFIESPFFAQEEKEMYMKAFFFDFPLYFFF
jgi:glycerophosphoryl diester phosphodiesterase